MTRPFFSIITPVYNTEAYLEECLRSVQEQDYTDWELIIINDGSPQRARYEEIKAEFSTDARFRFLDQENQGVGAARNAGLEVVRGHVTMFLDSDDKFLPGHFAGLAAQLRDYDENTIYCLHNYTDSIYGIVGYTQQPRRITLETELVFFSINVMRMVLPTTLARTTRFAHNFWHGEESLYIFTLYYAQATPPQFREVASTTAWYRNRPDSGSKQNKTRESENFRRIYRFVQEQSLTLRQRILVRLGLFRYRLYPTPYKYVAKPLTLVAKIIAGWWSA